MSTQRDPLPLKRTYSQQAAFEAQTAPNLQPTVEGNSDWEEEELEGFSDHSIDSETLLTGNRTSRKQPPQEEMLQTLY